MGKSLTTYHQYQIFTSDDAKTWKLIIDKSKNKTDVPHDYVVLPKDIQARYIKMVNRKFLYIINPIAGTGTAADLERCIHEEQAKVVFPYAIEYSNPEGNFQALIHKIKNELKKIFQIRGCIPYPIGWRVHSVATLVAHFGQSPGSDLVESRV